MPPTQKFVLVALRLKNCSGNTSLYLPTSQGLFENPPNFWFNRRNTSRPCNISLWPNGSFWAGWILKNNKTVCCWGTKELPTPY